MNIIETHVFYENHLIGKCSSTLLEVIPYENVCHFTLENYVGKKEQEIPLSGYEKLDISIFVLTENKKKTNLIELEIYPTEEIKLLKAGNIKVLGFINSKWKTDIYNQRIINIFKLWEQKEEFDWKNKNCTIAEKEAYCRACFIWGERLPLKKISSIEIDGKDIRDWYDFYILLSEKIIGKRKLFALGLDSLEDILIDFFPNTIGHEIRIRIINSTRIIEILGEEYFNCMEQIFNQFSIEILRE